MSTNSKPVIAYSDLREWLAEAERLGEVRTVRNANWQGRYRPRGRSYPAR